MAKKAKRNLASATDYGALDTLNKDTWVVQVKGNECGRSRYIMDQLNNFNLDPWKFHAAQFNTRDEANDWLTANDLNEKYKEHTLIAVQFKNAWYEKIKEKYLKKD
jgi:hypothetical protein